MKAILVLLLLFMSVEASSQDSTVMISNLQEKVIAQRKEIEKLEAKDSAQAASTEIAEPCLDCKPKLGWTWLYVLMPVILSFGGAFYFIGWLKREGYKISNALSDDIPEERLQQAQADQAYLARTRADMMAANAADPANNQPIPPADTPSIPMNRSSSRLIAFLSSMSASILAICIFSYYMYFAIKGMKVPEFEDLWPILTALGLGIVPYATKVVSGNSDSRR
ncbi:hypothetical protein J0A68_19290 [Algoriphagus sp. H41]|uniref:Uncharacterized protein n=1 Tax=Algoriphagus oliviformis TaxID=2811231 RepID=A0ABS3C7V5_9BACT|nr:hypothetical protein [Algoriphagus oliviformis]MBN7813108.1 hypothetical protein [Algoriphagus oliviformis]